MTISSIMKLLVIFFYTVEIIDYLEILFRIIIIYIKKEAIRSFLYIFLAKGGLFYYNLRYTLALL